MRLPDLSLCIHAAILLMAMQNKCMGIGFVKQQYDDHDSLLVQTTKGYVRGVTLKSATNKYVDAFLGIPFAQPPIGKLRFRYPKPMDPWTGVFNANEKPDACFQLYNFVLGDFPGTTKFNPNTPLSEDCLSINVWIPKPRPKKAAVMVWIYGGSLLSGSSSLDLYDPKILVSEEKVIVVSMNYRLSSLGFLYFGIPDAPGNAGFYDQLLGLHWVQDNIERFGGDPRRVTLFGESSGADSITLHLLSPLSRNLFRRAVLQSGAALAPWGFTDKDKMIQRGLTLAEIMKCPSDPKDLQAVVDCLREKDAFEMLSIAINISSSTGNAFGPIIDGEFIEELPSVSMAKGNLKHANILSGSNTEEGMFFWAHILPGIFDIAKDEVYLTREDFETSIRTLFPNVGKLAQEAIALEYTDVLNPYDPVKLRDAADKIFGDYFLTCDTSEFTTRYAESGNDVYQYLFAHRASNSPWPKWAGVLHADEIAFVFGHPLNSTQGYDEEDKCLSRRMMNYWTNFAKNGNPNKNEHGEQEFIYWPKHTSYWKEYLILETNNSTVGHGLRSEKCAFWKNTFPVLKENKED